MSVVCRYGNQSACGVWDAGVNAFDTTYCTVIDSDEWSTTCTCTDLGAYSPADGTDGLFVDISALSQLVLSDFISTFSVTKTPTLKTFLQNLAVFITMGKSCHPGSQPVNRFDAFAFQHLLP